VPRLIALDVLSRNISAQARVAEKARLHLVARRPASFHTIEGIAA
jgi:hypothetical protein